MNRTSDWRRKSFVVAASTMLLALGLNAQTPAPSSAAADEEEETEKLEKISVVGSRIKRLDAETPQPVLRIDRESLQNTGFSNLGDALRALPFSNAVSITPDDSNTGFASGTSSINLRGLGNNQTLVLINGRRAVPSGASAFNGFQSVIDLNQMPTSAVDSIEVLKDGASAIYGSDAVAGVININLRKDYVGAALDVSYGNLFNTDSGETSVFAIFGAAAGKTSITITANYFKKNSVANRDIDFASSADMRQDKTAPGQVELDPTGSFYTGIDWRSTSSFPARFFIPGENTLRSFVSPTSDPNPNSFVPLSRVTGAGFYDYQKVSWMYPEIESRGMTINARHEVSDTLYGFLDASFQSVNILNAAAGSPFTTTDKGAGVNNRLVVPAANPFNPFGERYSPGAGQDILLSTYRLVNAGPRYTDATSDYPRVIFGVGGDIGYSWTWETSYMWARGSYENLNPGTSFDSLVQQALQGVVIDGDLLYANPFGPEDPRITDFYSGTNPNSYEFEAKIWDVTASGDILDMPAGPLGIAVGAEVRQEKNADVRTIENETGNVVGGSEGYGFTGSRRVQSLFAELSIPIVTGLEAQLAARYEDYSDFGTTTKPKIALGYRPASWVLLRGSFSQSFKAPDLAYLYSVGNVSFTGSQLFDPKRPDQPSTQVKTVGRGTVGAGFTLEPEETDTAYLGAIFDFDRGPFRNVTFEAGIFRFDQKNRITRDSALFTLRNEDVLPAGRVVRKPVTAEEAAEGITVGILDYIATDWYNSDKLLYEGLDLAVRYRYDNDRFGKFRIGVEGTLITDMNQTVTDSLGNSNEIDLDGTNGYPNWRVTSTLAWNKGDWAASLYYQYVGGMPNDGAIDLRPQRRLNVQASYAGFFDSRIAVGVRNVFDSDPPLDLWSSGSGYFSGVYNPEPAFWYVRLSREF